MNIVSVFWDMVLESAPWLLLGFFLAGVIKQVVPNSWIQGQLAKPGLLSLVKGAFIGAPLPLCSCGVIPTALAVRKAGASKGATSSFLVATPETGVDSIAFSYAVLGPIFAIARPLAALFSAIVAGIFVTLFDKEEPAPAIVESTSSCCSSKAKTADGPELTFPQKMLAAIKYGFGNMISDIALWLVIGLAAAAIITAMVPQSFFLRWGDGVLAMLVMVLVGLPMYICATASTPVAASLLFAGISPGAALVFMLTGPATNIATMGVIREQLGNKSLLAYLVGGTGRAIICGLGLNALFEFNGWGLQLAMLEHTDGDALWRQLTAVLLVLLIARVWLQPLLARIWTARKSRFTDTAKGAG